MKPGASAFPENLPKPLLNFLHIIEDLAKKEGPGKTRLQVAQEIVTVLSEAQVLLEPISASGEDPAKVGDLTCQVNATKSLIQADIQTTETLRNGHLYDSLAWTLLIQDPAVHRSSVIRTILGDYLNLRTEQTDTLVSDDLLQRMNDPVICFSFFDKIKRNLSLENENKELKKRVQEQAELIVMQKQQLQGESASEVNNEFDFRF